MARVADQLIEELKKDLYSGALQPGDQLEESALAQRFGVSRTPVREALRSLVDKGLLETRARKGAVVRLLTAKELMDLFEVAAELEGMAARLAADRLTEPDAEAIKHGLEACEDAAAEQDEDAYAAANIIFHGAIHKASGNARLVEQLEQLAGHVNTYRSLPYKMRGRLAKSAEEHRQIMEAIFANEGDVADKLMREHMMLQGRLLPFLLQHLEEQIA